MISKKYSLLLFMLIASFVQCGTFKTKIFDSKGKFFLENGSVLTAEKAKFAHLDAQGKVVLDVDKELELNNTLSVGELIIKKAKKIQISNSSIETLVLEDNAADPIFCNCDIKKVVDRRKK